MPPSEFQQLMNLKRLNDDDTNMPGDNSTVVDPVIQSDYFDDKIEKRIVKKSDNSERKEKAERKINKTGFYYHSNDNVDNGNDNNDNKNINTNRMNTQINGILNSNLNTTIEQNSNCNFSIHNDMKLNSNFIHRFIDSNISVKYTYEKSIHTKYDLDSEGIHHFDTPQQSLRSSSEPASLPLQLMSSGKLSDCPDANCSDCNLQLPGHSRNQYHDDSNVVDSNLSKRSSDSPLLQHTFFDYSKFKQQLKKSGDYLIKRPGFYSAGYSSSDTDEDVDEAENKNNEQLSPPLALFDNSKHYFPNSDDSILSSSTRKVNKVFKIYRNTDYKMYEPLLEKAYSLFDNLRNNSMDTFFSKYGGSFNIQEHLGNLYGGLISCGLLYNQLTRKAMLLFAFDVAKNTLCKQISILPLMHEQMRTHICKVLENTSADTLFDVMNLLNNFYLPHYSQFPIYKKENMLAGFIILCCCAPYHYNSGYSYSISVDQSQQCIKFIDTFTTGKFSVIIDETERSSNKFNDSLITYSTSIFPLEKLLIIQNYNAELLNELHFKLQGLKLQKPKTFKSKVWLASYVNLDNFLEKHSRFFKVYRQPKSLLGYDRDYIVRVVSEWHQIFPYDLINLTKYSENQKRVTSENANKKVINEDFERIILIQLTFLSLRLHLEALVPGIRNFMGNPFSGLKEMDYDSVDELLKLYKLLTIKDYKIYGIYIIRFIKFMTTRFHRVKEILLHLNIPEFSGMSELSNEERCESLLNNWKFSDKLAEIQKISLDLKYGNYIGEYNYLNLNNGIKPELSIKNKINFRNKNDMILDFEKTNTGLFSKDYDVSNDPCELPSFTVDTDNQVNTVSLKNCWAINNYIKL